jgi:hypothetical protein
LHIARAHGCFQRHGCRRAKAFPAHRVELCVVRIRAVWPASYGAATAGRTRKSDVAHSLRHTLQHEDARYGGSQVRPGHAVRATSMQAHDNTTRRTVACGRSSPTADSQWAARSVRLPGLRRVVRSGTGYPAYRQGVRACGRGVHACMHVCRACVNFFVCCWGKLRVFMHETTALNCCKTLRRSHE